MLACIFADEDQVAATRVLRAIHMPDVKNPRSNRFSLDRTFQVSVKRIFSESAQQQGVATLARSVRGPLHKLGEVKKKCGLHPILINR